MRVGVVKTSEDRIATIKDYSNIGGKGEVAHFIAEVEIIKLDLLDIWENMQEENDSNIEVDLGL